MFYNLERLLHTSSPYLFLTNYVVQSPSMRILYNNAREDRIINDNFINVSHFDFTDGGVEMGFGD